MLCMNILLHSRCITTLFASQYSYITFCDRDRSDQKARQNDHENDFQRSYKPKSRDVLNNHNLLSPAYPDKIEYHIYRPINILNTQNLLNLSIFCQHYWASL